MNKSKLERDIASLEAKIENAKAYITPYENTLSGLREALRYACSSGDCSNVILGENYVPGTYLDKGYTHYYHKCSVCGYYKDIKTVSDGCYG